MFPIDVKAQIVAIEFAGLGLVENSQNRNGLQEISAHGRRLKIICQPPAKDIKLFASGFVGNRAALAHDSE
jgi:hypothetical protein